MPDVDGKAVICGEKKGWIYQAKIICECCKHKMEINDWCTHAKKTNPYTSVKLVETGKPLSEYRYCTYCKCLDAEVWYPGPFGQRSLCQNCGTKYRSGDLTGIYLKYLEQTGMGHECRLPGKIVSQKKTNNFFEFVINY